MIYYTLEQDYFDISFDSTDIFGSISFITKEYIHRYYDYGKTHIYEITLPTDNPNFHMLKENNEFRSNMVILGKKYPLSDPRTYFTLGIEMMSLDLASRNGYLDVVRYWFESGTGLWYTNHALDFASRNNHLDVVRYWFESGKELKYTNYAFDYASTYGYLDVIKYWFESGKELKYTECTLYGASKNGYLDVVRCWFESGKELKYTENVFGYALHYNHLNVIRYWFEL